jgi:hypothetical protein
MSKMRKPKLRLAEAISVGCQHAPVAHPEELVTRALQVVGALPLNLHDHTNYSPEQRRTLGYEHSTLKRLYPWLNEKQLCPWCADEIHGTELIVHPFAEHVCSEETTLEEQCQWLLDSEEELDPIVSVAITFRSVDERNAVLWAAQRQKLTLNAFLTAAVRLVLEHRLILTEFADPANEAR